MDSANLAGGGFRKLARIDNRLFNVVLWSRFKQKNFFTALLYFFLTQKSPRSVFVI